MLARSYGSETLVVCKFLCVIGSTMNKERNRHRSSPEEVEEFLKQLHLQEMT